MDKDKCERLLSDLEEAKGSFDIIIKEMQDAGIEYPYDKLISLVEESCYRISFNLEKIKSETPIYENLYEKNRSYLTRLKALRLSGLLFKLVLVNLIIFLAGKSDSYGIKSTAFLSGLMAWLGTDLVSADLQSRFIDPLKDKESLEYFERLDMERYKRTKEAANDIDTIYSINRNLWTELDKPSVLSLKRNSNI